MKINKTKTIAWVILATVYFFPFRYAFISGLNPGFKSLLNLLLVVIGSAVFVILIGSADKDHKQERP